MQIVNATVVSSSPIQVSANPKMSAYVGPKGDPGAAGVAGPQGPKGDPGDSSALRTLFTTRGAVYNSVTRCYELNGLTDITEDQMADIYNYTVSMTNQGLSCAWIGNPKIRTNYSLNNLAAAWSSPSLYMTFGLCANLEVAALVTTGGDFDFFGAVSINGAFKQCKKLRNILGIINLQECTKMAQAFENCLSLVEVRLKNLKLAVSFTESPDLSRASILYLINNATNTTPITVSLHATAKARLMATDIALASSKNITIA